MATKKKTDAQASGLSIPATPPAKGSVRVVRIASQRDGFRRAGLKHSKTATDHPIDSLTKDQLDALAAEPMLNVKVVDVPAKGAAAEAKTEEE